MARMEIGVFPAIGIFSICNSWPVVTSDIVKRLSKLSNLALFSLLVAFHGPLFRLSSVQPR